MWIEIKKGTPLRGSFKQKGTRLYVQYRTGIRLIRQGYAKQVEGRYDEDEEYGFEDRTVLEVIEAVKENNWNEMQRLKKKVCPEADRKKEAILEGFKAFLNEHGYKMPEVGCAAGNAV